MTNDKPTKRPGTALLDKASSGSVSTKTTAAKNVRKKLFFCIDSDCTLDDRPIKTFVNSLLGDRYN